MPTLEIIQITNGATKVLRTTKSYSELYKAYRRMQAEGAFVRMRIDGEVLPIYQADSRASYVDRSAAWRGGVFEVRELTHLSLFSGIGGLDLAAEWAGFKTVGQCEYADYPYAVLQKHWPDVPRWRDIRTLTAEDFYAKTRLHTVDIISGGFPCQPFSVAGKQRGTADDRYLWPEMCRIVRELHPAWVVGENVAGIVRIALAGIFSDLQSIGYTARAYSSAARDVGGLHKGERIFIVAASDDRSAALRRDTQFSSDASADGCSDNHRGRTAEPDLWERWEVEPRPYGVADGVPHRVDRLRCLGNAVVPQQAYPIFKAIAEVTT